MASNKTYLGFDFSTQQLKVLVMKDDITIAQEESVSFDDDLKEFNTKGGAHVHEDGLIVTAPTCMWVKALDLVLDKLHKSGFDFSSVCALSGTGQQHGSVYWKTGSTSVLQNLNSNASLYDQLKNTFSVENSPIWMDSSTSEECELLETAVDGAASLAKLTGSRGYERFTGSQIAKVSRKMKESYNNTEHISLVSSFGASLFLGKFANIDNSDGSGMNLLNIKTKKWEEKLTNCAGKDLSSKLLDTVPSCTVLGSISNYFVEKYGFHRDCKVVAFTGDNPASLAGCRLTKGDVIVSLGTSDTLFLWIDDPHPGTVGHVFVNPVNDDAYMGLLCFKNGSLTRERIRNEKCNGSWDKFSEYLRTTKPGNNGNMGVYFDVQEITPNAVGIFRYDPDNKEVSTFDDATEVRAVIESQFIAKRYYAEKLGYKITSNTRILATGGGSCNKDILQVLADVFQANVYTLDTSNSACLGCAYRAKHGAVNQETPTSFEDIVSNASPYILACKSNPYEYDVERYGDMISKIL